MDFFLGDKYVLKCKTVYFIILHTKTFKQI